MELSEVHTRSLCPLLSQQNVDNAPVSSMDGSAVFVSHAGSQWITYHCPGPFNFNDTLLSLATKLGFAT